MNTFYKGPLIAVCLMAVATRTPCQGSRLNGTVYDSLGGKPIASALIQLVPVNSSAASARTTQADSLGRFAIDSVLAGPYRITFYHPILDSLGLEAPIRDVVVEGGRTVTADLATPSPSRLRAAACQKPLGDATGLVMGIVRSARDLQPAPNTMILGQWDDLVISRAGLARKPVRIGATTGSNGWFALCGVPVGGVMQIRATNGADSSGVVEVTVPPNGLLRRDMFVASPGRSSVGSLSGRVISRGEDRGVPNARVAIDALEVRTNERGEWVLNGAASGTRTLEVHALGYLPEVRIVDVLDHVAPMTIDVQSVRSMLDTVHVVAEARARNLSGFEERRRTAAGRYMTGEYLARFQPQSAEQALRLMQGLRLNKNQFGEYAIGMRGAFGGDCAPAVFVDGFRVFGSGDAPSDVTQARPVITEDVENFVSPRNIAGIEVYIQGTVPSEFDTGMSGCGAVVIWSKR